MRFMRMASLVAGVVLLATALVGVLDRRDDLATTRDQLVRSAAEGAAADLDAQIDRVVTVLRVAAPDATATELGDALGLPVCIVEPDTSCSSDAGVPTADVAVERALEASRGGMAGITDAGERTVVVVAVGRDGGPAYATIAVGRLPAGAATVALVPAQDVALAVAHTLVGERRYAVALFAEFDDAPRAMLAAAPAAIRLTAGERWVFGLQLLVGGVLTLLALAAIVVAHRGLQRRATTDALTGLPNRTEFARRADVVLRRLRRDGGAACLLVIDLDGFKAINDSVGHENGDRVLAAAAARLQAAVRDSDLVGRWGGDEFVVLLPGIADERAIPARAAAVAAALADTEPIGGHELSASVGAARFPEGGHQLDELLRAADRAMYAAKLHTMTEPPFETVPGEAPLVEAAVPWSGARLPGDDA